MLASNLAESQGSRWSQAHHVATSFLYRSTSLCSQSSILYGLRQGGKGQKVALPTNRFHDLLIREHRFGVARKDNLPPVNGIQSVSNVGGVDQVGLGDEH